MSGEKNLDKLLPAMSPELIAGEFVFCSFEKAQYGDRPDLEPIAAGDQRTYALKSACGLERFPLRVQFVVDGPLFQPRMPKVCMEKAARSAAVRSPRAASLPIRSVRGLSPTPLAT